MAVFCVLLASSTFVQSCKKPDVEPDPIVPVLPVDSTKTGEPVVPLTKDEIIQTAIGKLTSDNFNIRLYSKSQTLFTYSLKSSGNVVRRDTSYSNELTAIPVTQRFKNMVDLTQVFPPPQFQGGNGPITKNLFFDKIFMDAAGDSFLAAINYNSFPITPISLSYFKDIYYVLNLKWSLPVDETIAILGNEYFQYYYNKDSVVSFGHLFVRNNTFLNNVDTLGQSSDQRIRGFIGKAIR